MATAPKKINVKVEGDAPIKPSFAAENEKARAANFAQARADSAANHAKDVANRKVKKVEAK